jgi:hypothetical protein
MQLMGKGRTSTYTGAEERRPGALPSFLTRNQAECAMPTPAAVVRTM